MCSYTEYISLCTDTNLDRSITHISPFLDCVISFSSVLCSLFTHYAHTHTQSSKVSHQIRLQSVCSPESIHLFPPCRSLSSPLFCMPCLCIDKTPTTPSTSIAPADANARAHMPYPSLAHSLHDHFHHLTFSNFHTPCTSRPALWACARRRVASRFITRICAPGVPSMSIKKPLLCLSLTGNQPYTRTL